MRSIGQNVNKEELDPSYIAVYFLLFGNRAVLYWYRCNMNMPLVKKVTERHVYHLAISIRMEIQNIDISSETCVSPCLGLFPFLN